jgi:hypothetical protein
MNVEQQAAIVQMARGFEPDFQRLVIIIIAYGPHCIYDRIMNLSLFSVYCIVAFTIIVIGALSLSKPHTRIIYS